MYSCTTKGKRTKLRDSADDPKSNGGVLAQKDVGVRSLWNLGSAQARKVGWPGGLPQNETANERMLKQEEKAEQERRAGHHCPIGHRLTG